MKLRRFEQAFTLMELVTVVVIIGVLVTMLIPAFTYLKSRAERIACESNLRSLYHGASSYVQDHQQWPQISTKDLQGKVYALTWIKALSPYGIQRINWVCPTAHRALQLPDLNKEENVRVDYFATPFGKHPRAPYRWATQPWFVERGDMHGNGNLVIFTNGKLRSLSEVRRDTSSQPYEF